MGVKEVGKLGLLSQVGTKQAITEGARPRESAWNPGQGPEAPRLIQERGRGLKERAVDSPKRTRMSITLMNHISGGGGWGGDVTSSDTFLTNTNTAAAPSETT